MRMAQERERVTSTRVAELFRVDNSTVKRWAGAGKIPSHRMPSGRYVFFLDEIVPLLPESDAEAQAS